jgi:16S rRNA (guanine966-N2)-methyltransferase
MKNAVEGQLRIIAGHWRGRKLSFLDREGLRPTPDRVRETLFNWLQADTPGSRCLDLFAGSGALGFEAASRGAKSVVMLDREAATVTRLKDNINRLQAGNIQVTCIDAVEYLQADSQKFDVVFVDPPYQSDLLVRCCTLLEQKHWLANHAKIYLECDAYDELTDLPENWHCQKRKKAGQVAYQLYTRDDGPERQ